jgi:uncharacterized membrane protein
MTSLTFCLSVAGMMSLTVLLFRVIDAIERPAKHVRRRMEAR